MSPFLSCALTLGLVSFQGLPEPHVGVSAFTMWPMSETKRLASHALGKTYMTGLARSFTNHLRSSLGAKRLSCGLIAKDLVPAAHCAQK